MTAPRRFVVVGAGIAGLAAAHRLREIVPADEVVVLDADTRAGGIVATEHAHGFTLETGPDAFITEKPWALALCERLGIADRLVGTSTGERRTWVVQEGRLLPLPDGFLLLAPTALLPLASSPLFSWRGKLRMALDLVLPRRREPGDESLAGFVRRRLGTEALARVADPLMGGIYTADPERLSLAATMPRFLELERRHGSVIRGLRAAAPATAGTAGARYGLFVTPAGGMSDLVTALVRRLPEGALRLGSAVTALARTSTSTDERWTVTTTTDRLDADGVVLATPGFVTGPLLASIDAELARDVGAIRYASSATVTLGYRSADVEGALRGFGFVVPFAEGRPLLACTFASRKFPGRAPEGHELLRAFVGGARRPELVELDDDALVVTVRRQLDELLGIRADPVLTRVRRWRRAMPQYDVGHLDRVAAIEARVAHLRGLALAGAAYRGVGIPDCVRSGEAAAEAVASAARTRP